MMTDLHALPTGLVLAADLCVVGSGPAGLTIASEFANTRQQVVLLEAGGSNYEADTQAMYEGDVVGRSYPIAFTRLRMFGGTSAHWEGLCSVRPARHFKARPGVTDATWPITVDELLPYYQKANRLLQLGHFDYNQAEAKGLAHGIAPSAAGLVEHFLWRTSLEGALRFGPHMRRDMEEAANIQVILHANVTGLITNDQASQIEGIQFSTLDGKKGVVRARCFVLACGALEAARLLLGTDRVQSFGLGNSRGIVGRYFMEHINANIGRLYLSDPSAATALSFLAHRMRDKTRPIGFWRPTLCLGEKVEREQRTGGGYYRFASPDPTWLDAVFRFRNPSSSLFEKIHILASVFDEAAYAVYRRARGYSAGFSRFDRAGAVVGIQFEQLPNRDSRVFLSGERDRLGLRRLALDWRLTEGEIRTARTMGEAIGREAYLRRLGPVPV